MPATRRSATSKREDPQLSRSRSTTKKKSKSPTLQASADKMTTEKETPEKKTVKGSCHCGTIKYEMRIPKDFDTITRCNCTMCQKPGMVGISLDSSGSDFDLLSPKDVSEVKYYQYRSKDCYRYFCDKCGIQVWGNGKYTFDGKEYAFFSVNAHTVDQPQDGFDASELKVNYVDGLKDNWMVGTKDKPFPGGIP